MTEPAQSRAAAAATANFSVAQPGLSVQPLAASGADLSADFDGRYLQDGYWLLGEREGGLVAYAENGKVAGIAPSGAAYPFVNDRKLSSIEALAGKRIIGMIQRAFSTVTAMPSSRRRFAAATAE